MRNDSFTVSVMAGTLVQCFTETCDSARFTQLTDCLRLGVPFVWASHYNPADWGTCNPKCAVHVATMNKLSRSVQGDPCWRLEDHSLTIWDRHDQPLAELDWWWHAPTGHYCALYRFAWNRRAGWTEQSMWDILKGLSVRRVTMIRPSRGFAYDVALGDTIEL